MKIKTLAESKREMVDLAAQVAVSGSAVAKRRPATKTSAKTTSKASKPAPKAAKATATKRKPPTPPIRDMDENGFVVGSDSAKIAAALVEGSTSRKAINSELTKLLNADKNRNGNPKNVPSLVSGIIRVLLQRGFTVEESFQMSPPLGGIKKAAPVAAKKAAPVSKKGAHPVAKGTKTSATKRTAKRTSRVARKTRTSA